MPAIYDEIFIFISVTEKNWFKFHCLFPVFLIDNKSELFQVMALHRIGDKPLPNAKFSINAVDIFFEFKLSPNDKQVNSCHYIWLTVPLEMWLWFQKYKFRTQFGDWYLEYSINYYPGINARGFRWWEVNIGPGNGWCRQTTSHYLSRRWPRSPSTYRFT